MPTQLSGVFKKKSHSYLNPHAYFAVWAFSFGCIVGWGSFVMPGTTFLPIAGPLGTLIAMTSGALIVLVIAANFHTMMTRIPHSGGVFSFTKNIFGYDHSFLCAWAIALAYISLIWANATAFILIARYLFGTVLQWGFHYTVAGYDVYFGEILATLLILLFFGFLSIRSSFLVSVLQSLLASVLFLGVISCFVLALMHKAQSGEISFFPLFSNENSSHPVWQILNIVALVPWAFVGFETICLIREEKTDEKTCSHRMKKSFAIMAVAIFCGAAVYVTLAFLSVLAVPEGMKNWSEYISHLSKFNGIDALPTFHAAKELLGKNGIALLGLCVFSALSTSMFGFYRATARLIQAMADDSVLPAWFSNVNERGVPQNAIVFIMAISVIIPFFGRTAIGWLTDITTVSACIAYAYISLCSLKKAREEKNSLIAVCGIAGFTLSIIFFFGM